MRIRELAELEIRLDELEASVKQQEQHGHRRGSW